MKKYFALSALLFCSLSHAEIYYPELQVSPRASERLLMEARHENKDNKHNFLAIQASAAMTLLAGVYAGSQQPSEDKVSSQEASQARNVAIGIGAGWLAATYFLEQNYRPYTKGLNDIKSLPSSTPQEQLTRERLAEEQIDSAAGLGSRLMWMSLITNLGASSYLASRSEKEPSAVAYVSAVMAFAPLVFRTNWQTVGAYHHEYKKKIYGPIVSSGLFQNSTHLSPGLIVSWNF